MRILSNDTLSNVPTLLSYAHGGTSRFAADFSAYVQERGHTWIGLINSREGELSSSIRALYSHKGCEFHEVSLETWNVAVGDVEKNIERRVDILASALSGMKVDVVFVNGSYLYCLLLALAAKKSNIPVVMQHAGIWKNELLSYPDVFSPDLSAVYFNLEKQVALKATDANIFLNDFSLNEFMSVHQVDAVPNSQIIPLPHAGWEFLELKKKDEPVTLGVVARWDKIKNLPAILALAREVKRRGLPWKIHAVTDIPQTEFNQAMKQEFRELIHVIPGLTRKEMGEFLQGISMLLVPSNFDVSPTVVMEAISSGTPSLISPRVGWVSEYGKAGMNQWIVPFEDPGVVVERILDLFNQETWKEAESLAKIIQECHNPETVYARYMDVFTSICNPQT